MIGGPNTMQACTAEAQQRNQSHNPTQHTTQFGVSADMSCVVGSWHYRRLGAVDEVAKVVNATIARELPVHNSLEELLFLYARSVRHVWHMQTTAHILNVAQDKHGLHLSQIGTPHYNKHLNS